MSFLRFLYRGAFTGILGGMFFVIGLTLHDLASTGHVPYSGALQIMAVPLVSFMGLIFGSFIGSILWIIECRAKIHLPMIGRAVLGIIFVFIVGSVIQLFEGQRFVQPINADWVINLLMFVIALGAFPAIFALPAPVEDGAS